MNVEVGENRFQTTLWTVIMRAGSADGLPKEAALDQLCRTYWKPLFVYCLGKGLKVEDAEDLTQSFFARLLARDSLRVADPLRGRFRAFLLTSFKNFIADEGDRSRARRRGGDVVHLFFDGDFTHAGLLAHQAEFTPERAYDQRWALDLVDRATVALRAEHESRGKGEWFERVAGPSAGTGYAEVAREFTTTEEAVKSFAKRVRRRFRELLEREIADTVGSPEEVADEMAYLVDLLRG